MPAIVHKIDFSAPADCSHDSGHLSPFHRKVIPFAPGTSSLSVYHPHGTIPHYRRHEPITAVFLAVSLHLAGFTLMPDATQEELVTSPTPPIAVSWITAPQPKTENLPTAPPKQQKQALKPKPKTVKRIKAKPKAVLSTSAPTPTATTTPAEAPGKTASQAAATPAAAPAINAVRQASSAPPLPIANAPQPLILPNLNADYLDNPAPRYPEEARERGEQGKVLVRALINADGTVAELAMKRSSGFPELDQSALETVKKWRFVPARRGAATVSAWVVVPISFTLEG